MRKSTQRQEKESPDQSNKEIQTQRHQLIVPLQSFAAWCCALDGDRWWRQPPCFHKFQLTVGAILCWFIWNLDVWSHGANPLPKTSRWASVPAQLCFWVSEPFLILSSFMTESKHTQSISRAGQVEQAFNLQHATTGNISTEFRNVENQRVCVT